MASAPIPSPPVDTTPPPSNTTPPPSNTTPPTNTTTPPPDPSIQAPPPSDASSPPPPPPSSSAPPPAEEAPLATPPPPSPSPPAQGGKSSAPPPSTTVSPPPSPSDKNSLPASPPPHSPQVPPPPPPPPPSSTPSGGDGQLSPPPPPNSRKSHTNGDNSTSHHTSNAINLPLIIGASAGIGLFFILMIVAVLCCSRKKKRSNDDHINYYSDTPRKQPNKGYYGSSPQANQWNPSPAMMDQMMAGRIPPPPGAAGWQYPQPPPQPPPALHSSDMSSSNYSGGWPWGPPLPPPSPNVALGFNKSTFTYEELAAATDGFSEANMLGQGGFGYVYKGVLAANGKEIAVKKLKSGSGQGEKEFQAEVEIISRVHHRHLVSLVGYCIADGQRMLVYEFVPNNTLEFHLHGKGRPTMDFSTRLKIAIGSAKGLAYLHEDCHPRIIHRDIKAANILLDYNFEAMVADFGLAKPSSDLNTHVSTRVMGTFGYLAPEYASSGKLTEKSDVFSFGVMLLELITGRRPVDRTNNYMEESLVEWARPLLTKALDDGNIEKIVDPRLEKNYSPAEMMRMAACAAAGVRHSAKRRPKMSQIVRALEGDVSLDDLNEGVKPGQSTMFSSTGSSDHDSTSYNADMKKMRRMALGTEEFASNKYSSGPPTSEYGQNPSSSSSDAGYSPEVNGRRYS